MERRLGGDTWRVMEALQVMSLLLLKMLVQVLLMKALLKVSELLFLSSSLTRTQTRTPQTRLAARTSR